MLFWNQCVEVLRESIFAYAQVCNGNLGAGILVVTFLARLALVPLAVRMARAARVQQRTMQRLQPQLDALRAKYKTDPRRLAEETQRLMRREGVSALSGAGCLGGLAQAPVFIALYSAVRQAAAAGGRFLWVRNIAKPDWLVAIAATAFTFLAAMTGGGAPGPNRTFVTVLSTVVTLAMLSKMAAGIGLYWGLSSLFGAVQGFVIERSMRHHTA
jgi:YidC/Oxa1 family membrane protein insertase